MTAETSGSTPRADPSAIAALLVVQALFALNYLASKAVVAAIEPAVWALLRALLGGGILLAWVALRGPALPRGAGRLARMAGLALIGVALNQWLFVEGIRRTTPGHSSAVNASIPVLVLLVAVILGRERPTRRRVLGIAITIAGVATLLAAGSPGGGGGEGAAPAGGPSLLGDLLTLANAVSFSFFLVLGKPVLERERTLPATALLLAFGAMWLLPIGLPGLLALDPRALEPRILALAAFIVLGATIAAYGLNTFAIRRVESSLVALFIYVQPVLAGGLSVALGMEQASGRLVLAAAVIFAGIAVAVRAPDGGVPSPPAG